MPTPSPISVVIASKGRPAILAEAVSSLGGQTLAPDRIVLVVPTQEDLPRGEMPPVVQTIVGPLGATLQRNAGIAAIPLTVPYVAFFDDDYEPKEDYLENAVLFLEGNPDVMAFSGREVWDTPPIARTHAREMLDALPLVDTDGSTFRDKGKHFVLYGCNMVIRRDVLEQERFDENLPLYSYGEDYELTMRLLRHGRVGRYLGCAGVHLLVPSGRVREVQRTYSEVANNWYFLKKGSVHLPFPLAFIRFWVICAGRLYLRALWKMLRGDRSADWRGRLEGCGRAVGDILLCRSHPRRVLDL